MIDTREYISNLDMPEKVTLFKELYNELAGYGIDGDTELAHVNTFEASLLKSLGGSGTINDITGLTEYKSGGEQAPPTQSTVTQTSEFPTELKPFIKDILGEGQAEFEREKEEGFLAFPGPQLAQFTPEQQAAFAGGRQQFTGLAGTPLGQASTYYAPALASTALGTSEIGTADIQRRMDPFLQNVVDIAKREAGRDEEAARQQRAAQAVGAGSFGGSRQAILEAEGERNLAERLGDIQARGLSASFQQAQQAAEQQRVREMTGGRQFAALGDITGARARTDLAGLAGIGETQQQRSQQALDIAQREFEQERAFPQAALQKYASLIRGFPLQATQQRFATQTVPTPSFAQTLLGGAGQAAGLYGMMGGFSGNKEGGLVSLQDGGLPTVEKRFLGGVFRKSGTAQPQSVNGAPSGGSGSFTPEMMEMLSKHAQGKGAVGYTKPQQFPQFSQGNVGGYGVTPMPSPEQSPPIVSATQDQEKQQMTALNAMQQRGAALRQLAKPTAIGSPQFNQQLGINVARNEGGLMSVVKRDNGGDLYNFNPIVMDPTLRPPPSSQPDRRFVRSFSGAPMLEEAYRRAEALQTKDYGYPSDTALKEKQAALLKGRADIPEWFKDRIAASDEAKRRAHWGNVAGFFGRLGTSTAPAAQVGGLRGLLGAGVAAGAETIPDVLATEKEFRAEERDLQSNLLQANLDTLKLDLDISESEFARGTDKAQRASELGQAFADRLINIAKIEADRADALGTGMIQSKDVRTVLATMQAQTGARYVLGADGKLKYVGGEPLGADQQAEWNLIFDEGIRNLQSTGGDYSSLVTFLTERINKSVLGQTEKSNGGPPVVPDVPIESSVTVQSVDVPELTQESVDRITGTGVPREDGGQLDLTGGGT